MKSGFGISVNLEAQLGQGSFAEAKQRVQEFLSEMEHLLKSIKNLNGRLSSLAYLLKHKLAESPQSLGDLETTYGQTLDAILSALNGFLEERPWLAMDLSELQGRAARQRMSLQVLAKAYGADRTVLTVDIGLLPKSEVGQVIEAIKATLAQQQFGNVATAPESTEACDSECCSCCTPDVSLPEDYIGNHR